MLVLLGWTQEGRSVNPIRFAEANTVMLRPKGMEESECSDLHAFTDGRHVITCWQPTPEERVKIAMGEPVWLLIVGVTMPPSLVTADKPLEPRA